MQEKVSIIDVQCEQKNGPQEGLSHPHLIPMNDSYILSLQSCELNKSIFHLGMSDVHFHFKCNKFLYANNVDPDQSMLDRNGLKPESQN